MHTADKGNQQTLPAPRARPGAGSKGDRIQQTAKHKDFSTAKSHTPQQELKKKERNLQTKRTSLYFTGKIKSRRRVLKSSQKGPSGQDIKRTSLPAPLHRAQPQTGDNSQESLQRTGEGARRPQTGGAQHRAPPPSHPAKATELATSTPSLETEAGVKQAHSAAQGR